MSDELNIAVFSDTHGNRVSLEEAVQFIRSRHGVDRLIHLGDGVEDGETAAKNYGIPFAGVAGNEDFGVSLPPCRLVEAGPWRMLCLHGYQYEINAYQSEEEWEKHLNEMARRAERHGASVLLFGHTHRQMLLKRNGVIFCNPGDMYRGSREQPGFALLNVSGPAMRAMLMKKQDGQLWTCEREESWSFSEVTTGRAH